jgi:hypothetical protein
VFNPSHASLESTNLTFSGFSDRQVTDEPGYSSPPAHLWLTPSLAQAAEGQKLPAKRPSPCARAQLGLKRAKKQIFSWAA